MPRAPPPAAAVAPPDPARRGRHRPWRITAILCIAELLSMSGFATYPALLAQLRDLWGLSGAAAGFVGGSLFAGYMAAVPFLSGLTDRVDGRGVYAFAGGLAAAGAIAFAVLAQGVWSAALCQAVVGAGLAGTYMPGLKAISPSTPRPSASAPAPPCSSPARLRRSPAGAGPSSWPAPGRWPRACWCCGR